MEPERFLSSLASVVLGLVLFPVVMVIVLVGWERVAGVGLLGTVVATAAGLAIFVLVVWKGHGMLRGGLYNLGSRFPEPLYSCLEIGVSGALAIGVFMAVPILLLGHTRPMGWEFDRIPRWMAFAFLVGLVCGLPLGIQRRRVRKSRVA
jgi:hypothetical protein